MVGDQEIHGKEAFVKLVEQMQKEGGAELKINNVITHGKGADVDGTMRCTDKSGKEKAFAFCDIYTFSGFKNPKIKMMTSYVIEISDL